MINNTNFTHWNRLQAKSLDAQFMNEMVKGLNCSPFEAEAIVEKVHDIYRPLLETSQGPKPGQIQVTVIDASVPPNVPLAKAKQRLVTLTLQAGQEDIETRQVRSPSTAREWSGAGIGRGALIAISFGRPESATEHRKVFHVSVKDLT